MKKCSVCKLEKDAVLFYKKNLRPSIDRLDDYKTYTLNNIRITTWEENNKKGRFDRKNGINNKVNKAVAKLNDNNEIIEIYHSLRELERIKGFNHSYIAKCCRGEYKKAYGFKWSYLKSEEDCRQLIKDNKDDLELIYK